MVFTKIAKVIYSEIPKTINDKKLTEYHGEYKSPTGNTLDLTDYKDENGEWIDLGYGEDEIKKQFRESIDKIELNKF